MSTNNRQAIEAALKATATGDLRTSANALLDSLGYTSNKTLDLPAQPRAFAQEIETLLGDSRQFNAEAVCLSDWKSVAFLFPNSHNHALQAYRAPGSNPK